MQHLKYTTNYPCKLRITLDSATRGALSRGLLSIIIASDGQCLVYLLNQVGDTCRENEMNFKLAFY